MTVYKVSAERYLADDASSLDIPLDRVSSEAEECANQDEIHSVAGIVGCENRRAVFRPRSQVHNLMADMDTQSISDDSEQFEPIILQPHFNSFAGAERKNRQHTKKHALTVEQILVLLSAAVMLSGILTGALVWRNNGYAHEEISSLLPVVSDIGFWESGFNAFLGFLPFVLLAFLSSFFVFGSLLIQFDLFVFAIGIGFKICCVVNSIELGFGAVAKLLALSLVTMVLVNVFFKEASLYSLRLLREGLNRGLIVFAIKSLAIVVLLFLICCGAVAVLAK